MCKNIYSIKLNKGRFLVEQVVETAMHQDIYIARHTALAEGMSNKHIKTRNNSIEPPTLLRGIKGKRRFVHSVQEIT